MKTILVPTDYSKTALNATDYAIEMAKTIKAKIILLHVFEVPMVVTDIPVVIDTYDDFEKAKKEEIKNHEKALVEKYGKSVSISSIVTPGFLGDEIKEIVNKKKIDLIVMGITNVGKLSEILIGSNATQEIRTIDCPVITVHENLKFKPVKKIAFATDYEDIEESHALDQVIEFVKLFKAKLMMVNVADPDEKTNYKKELSGELLEHVFDKVNHTVSFQTNEDIIEGINNFVDKNKIDVLIMLPKKHSFFSRLFQESNTKKMAFHSHAPLLTIHN